MNTPARIARVLILVAAALVAVLSVAGPAAAHAVLRSTDPAAGALLKTAPTQVTLTFDEPVDTSMGYLRVLASDGARVDTGPLSRPGPDRVAVALHGGLRVGTYVVTWRVQSADSHPVSGAFDFSYGASTRAATLVTERPDRTVGVLLGMARWLGYAGVILLIGPALIGPALSGGVRALMVIGIGALLVGALAELLLQGPYAAGTGLSTIGAHSLRAVLDTGFGKTVAARAVLTAVCAAALARLRASVPRAPAIAVFTALILTFSLAGHPKTSRWAALTVTADAVHVAAASVWIGGLAALAWYALRRADGTELAVLLPRWSRWAMGSVIALALSGSVQALAQFTAPGQVLSTTYGRLLMIKLAIVAVILAFAASARSRVRSWPAAGPGSAPMVRAAAGRLRRGVLAEIALAAGVLAVTAVLVQTAPAREAAAVAADASDTAQGMGAMDGGSAPPYSVTLHQSGTGLTFVLDHAATGTEHLDLTMSGPIPRQVEVAMWLPARGVDPITVPVTLTGARAGADVTVPLSGTWTFRVTVRTSDIDEVVFTTAVPVR